MTTALNAAQAQALKLLHAAGWDGIPVEMASEPTLRSLHRRGLIERHQLRHDYGSGARYIARVTQLGQSEAVRQAQEAAKSGRQRANATIKHPTAPELKTEA